MQYNAHHLLKEIELLIGRVLRFTPETFTVTVRLVKGAPGDQVCFLCVENTGVNLSKLGEVLSSVKKGMRVKEKAQGTVFMVSIPTIWNPGASAKDAGAVELLPKKYPNYYASVVQRLTTHFYNIENLEKAAALRGPSEGVFLKKVNSVIESYFFDPNFKVDALANAMALSRTQLFRKMKALTKKSPQQYLRFVRLDKAKKLLQSKQRDLNVSEVCYEVGFASKSHFTRAFKKEFGFCPSELVKVKNAT
ncbi:helix-turn-helix domain-containing protein [Maribacter sp. 2307ULW6-5]|uniref:helix-turn-helix domain-containing protein n=1 Tax=Maribacter sp. 2307ULW6-5 TaxID=3386275 RepID=UPI0039BCD5E9